MTIAYRTVKTPVISMAMILCVFISFSFSTQTSAINNKQNSVYVFHSGVEQINNEFTIPLLVELEKQLSSHSIKLIDVNEQTPIELQLLMNHSVHCAVTVGSLSLKTVLATRSNSPIFSTLTPQTELDRLIGSYRRINIPVSGIYQEQSFRRQLLLSKAIDPNKKNVAIILGRQTRYTLPRYQQETKLESMNLVFGILKHQASPQQYFSQLSLDNTFLLIINDQEHYSDYDLQSLLVTGYKKGIAIIGGKQTDTEVAAIASIYTPYTSLIKETAIELKKICSGAPLPKPRYSKYYKVFVNQQTAEYLNYNNLNEKELENIVHQLENDSLEMTKQ